MLEQDTDTRNFILRAISYFGIKLAYAKIVFDIKPQSALLHKRVAQVIIKNRPKPTMHYTSTRRRQKN